MIEIKPVTTPSTTQFKLSKAQSPQTEEWKIVMETYPYANIVGSIM